MVTAGECPVWPWCRAGEAAHRDGWHGTHVGQWRLGAVVVDVQIMQAGDEPPVVHVDLTRDDGRSRCLELGAAEARAVSEVLDMFDPDRGAGGVGDLLHNAGDTIDPDHERATPW
ncbi:hypothetical protein ACWDA3_55615 [Nonomuraea rubra]